MLKPYKFMVIAVVQTTDEDGQVTGEATIARDNGEPFAVYGLDGLHKFADDFPDMLAAAEARG